MRAGFYLGLVQLLFATTWTVYVVFLPALAEAPFRSQSARIKVIEFIT